jgi:2Fe-2S ferredoxin
MPKVIFQYPKHKNGGAIIKQIEAKNQETLLDIALANDIDLEHACGGFCACTTCHVQVIEGLDHLSEIDTEEMDRLDYAKGSTPNSRLGCQAKVTGDVRIELVNV